MKIIKKILIICISLFIFTGCISNASAIFDKRNTTWKSENPEMSFTVPSENSDSCIIGTLQLEDGENLEFELSGRETMIFIQGKDKDEKGLTQYGLNCKCSLKGNKYTLKNITHDTIFNGKYDKITFYRQELDEDTSKTESEDT